MFDNNQFVADLIGREPAFPLYEMLSWAPPAEKTRAREILSWVPFTETTGATPGRFLILRDDPPLKDSDLAGAGPTDIIWAPLYDYSKRDISKQPEKLPFYDNNLAVIAKYAPLVKGVLVGNEVCEILFNDVDWDNFASSNLYEFVNRTNDLVSSLGGQFYAAPLTWHFLEDCYFKATGKMKDLFLELKIPVVCLCGYTMFQYRTDWNCIDIANYEKNPFPQMRKYLSGMNAISGVNGLGGIREGIDEMLKFYGFEGGVFSREFYM